MRHPAVSKDSVAVSGRQTADEQVLRSIELVDKVLPLAPGPGTAKTGSPL
jgi:hypothetical protein